KGVFMRYARPMQVVLLIPALAAALAAQSATKPTNDAPNPYNTVSDYFKLPAGRTWGSTSAVEIDKDGKSIWVAERCGANSCLDRATGKMSDSPTVLKFDSSGKLVKSFGAGMLLFPLGKPGGAAAPEYFYQPNDVVTAPNGDIFVGEGHGAGNNRILKFDKTGKLIKEWGKLGTGPGEFDGP